jgi:intracellular sulfur oxidation DsrE/DsrF family protein
MTKFVFIIIALVGVAVLGPVSAQESAFSTGPLIKDYGPAASIEGREAIPPGTKFKVSFDVAKQAEPGKLNRTFVGSARFLNMHAKAGVPVGDMKLAVVVHGSAVHDVTNAVKYGEKHTEKNANADLIKVLLANGVEIYVCGQSATYQNVHKDDLLPGVKMSLSAMTAHAMLQQSGYTVNPF